jgi:zinc protease
MHQAAARLRAAWARALAGLLLAMLAWPVLADVPLKLQRFKLANGLEVILAEDRRVPQVALNLWVHAGPREERAGQTGFAYLFEHLMSGGTRHVPRGAAEALVEAAGGTVYSSNTNFDRSSYSLVLPAHQLELGLWLQSDMLGWALDGLDASTLAAQQAVIRQERRQNAENRPYGIVDEAVYSALFPPWHPYRAAVIGTHADIQAFKLDAVREFGRSYYRPNNATLVLVGDVDPARARGLVQRYFGSLRAGPPVAAVQVAQPVLQAERRVTITDTVDLPRVTMAWHTPAAFRPGDAELDLAAGVLGGGRAGRLYRSLIQDRALAASVDVSQYSLSLGSVFTIEVVARPGVTLAQLEAALDEELGLLSTTPPTVAELQRAVAATETRLFHRLEKPAGLAEQLNLYQRFTGSAAFLDRDLARYRLATPDTVRAAVAAHLRPGARVVVHGVPGPQALAPPVPVPLPEPDPAAAERLALNAPEPWRELPPPAAPMAPVRLPDGTRQQLPNGLTVVHVPQPGVPLVSATLVVRAGMDRTPADRPGLASFTAALLDQGTRQRSASDLADAVAAIGASLAIDFGAEDVRLTVAGLARHLPAALALLAEMVVQPAFPPEAIARQKLLRAAALERQRSNPASVADVVARAAYFGVAHPLGASRLGSTQDIETTTRNELLAFWRTTYRPDEAALVVSGDVDQATVLQLAQRVLGAWRAPPGNSPPWQPPAAQPTAARVVLVGAPGAGDTVLQLIGPGPAPDAADAAAATVLNQLLAGAATARLQAALRPLQGRAGASLALGRSQASWSLRASLPAAQTTPGIAVLLQQVDALRQTPPAGELLAARTASLLALPADLDTNDALSQHLASVWARDLPSDHMARWTRQLAAVQAAAVQQAARSWFDAAQLRLVAVGDPARLQAAVQALGLGPVEWRDADGQPLPPAPGTAPVAPALLPTSPPAPPGSAGLSAPPATPTRSAPPA